ncbi:MAG TPA: class I SAM-dependent methyltransferase [Candidatus Limnocylindria bacterium]|nr:class I SAM-dependent methyltransferase [Candidatus Limnocylindria bacterium]
MKDGTRDLRSAILRDYRHGQGAISTGSVYRDIEAMWPYYEVNYAVVARSPRQARILELGCGHGSLLAWLKEKGFRDLRGVDASPGDVEFANGHLGGNTVELADAAEFLDAHPASYDVVIAKALLEHVPRADLLRTVRGIGAALSDAGIAVIEVPNMDWLTASHERYMDLTHEVGFTRESLGALLRLVFAQSDIGGSRIAYPTRSQRLLRPALVWVLRRALYVLGEGASDTLFASRSLIAVARAPRRG